MTTWEYTTTLRSQILQPPGQRGPRDPVDARKRRSLKRLSRDRNAAVVGHTCGEPDRGMREGTRCKEPVGYKNSIDQRHRIRDRADATIHSRHTLSGGLGRRPADVTPGSSANARVRRS